MAATQPLQERHQMQRVSVGPNILSKMLQMEKQSKEHRVYAATAMGCTHSKPDRGHGLQDQIALAVRPAAPAPDTQNAHVEANSRATGNGSYNHPVRVQQAAGPNTTEVPTQTAPTFPSKPPMSRAQTMPTLSPDPITPAPKERKKPTLEIDTSKAEQADKRSIVGSPGWPDPHGKRARRNEKMALEAQARREKKEKEAAKKAQKEADIKAKKDAEKAKKETEKQEAAAKKEAERQEAAAKKTGKREGRLSKKPPAAMDTQRMPSGLTQQQSEARRNSFRGRLSFSGSSGENSRRNSRELTGQSGVSIGSGEQQRSRSTPATSAEYDDPSAWQPVVSPAPPQLPAISSVGGWHSGSGSSGESRPNSSNDGAYNPNRGSKSPQQMSFGPSLQTPPRPLGRSHTDTALVTVGQEQPVLREVHRAVAEPQVPYYHQRNRQHGAQAARGPASSSESNQRPLKGIEVASAREGATSNTSIPGRGQSPTKTEANSRIHPLQSNPTIIHTGPSSLDGSSYVHKQRMYQQQRSMAGFKDEEAVRDATRLMDEEAQLSRSKDASPVEAQKAEIFHVNDHTETVQPIPQLPSSGEHGREGKDVAEPHSGYIKQPSEEEAAGPIHEDNMPESTKSGFLGFPRRPKAVKHASFGTTKSRSSVDTTHTPPSLPSPPLDVEMGEHTSVRPLRAEKSPARASKPEQSPVRVPKAERILSEPPPPRTPPDQTLTGRSKLSQAVVDKERSPASKKTSPRDGRPTSRLANAAVDKGSPPRKSESPIGKKETSPAPSRSNSIPDVAADEAHTKDGTLVRSHSRTRTSSSQLLNDNVPMLRASNGPPSTLPRSTTAPVLPSFSIQSFSNQADESHSALANAETNYSSPAKAPNDSSKAPEEKPLTEQSDSLVRKTSLKRPRSNPQLQVTPAPPSPDLDFLPPLRHQPLVKPKPRLYQRNTIAPGSIPGSSTASSQFPLPAAPFASNNSGSTTPPRSPLRPSSDGSPKADRAMVPTNPIQKVSNFNTSTHKRMSGLAKPFSSELDKPVAKLFTMCCGCRKWHDLPSGLYEALVRPIDLKREKTKENNEGGGGSSSSSSSSNKRGAAEATLDAVVKCPWCEHFMSRMCCASWTGIVYLHERHH